MRLFDSLILLFQRERLKLKNKTCSKNNRNDEISNNLYQFVYCEYAKKGIIIIVEFVVTQHEKRANLWKN